MSIEKPSSSSPLIYKVEYVFTDEIQTFQRVGLFAAIITLVNGKIWKEFYASPSSVKLNDQQADVDAGTKHDQLLQLSFPGNDAFTHGKIAELEGRRFVLKLYYQDGTIKVIGHPDEPALIKINYQTEASNFYPITFSCASSDRIRYLYNTAGDIPSA